MTSTNEMDGKVALVTGGAAGIGRATAIAFAARGAAVMVSDIADAAGAAVVDEIFRTGGRALYHRADATREDEVIALMDRIGEAFGRLDYAFNNVGYSWGTGVEDISEDDWDKTIDLCLKAPWLCMKHELPLMVAQGAGAIVNTASMAAIIHAPSANIAYSAAKAGVLQMTRYVANAYADKGIRANSVSPGLTRTAAVEAFLDPGQQNALASQTQPIGRIVEPAEIADAVIWLCSNAAAMVTGENICVAGGHQAR